MHVLFRVEQGKQGVWELDRLLVQRRAGSGQKEVGRNDKSLSGQLCVQVQEVQSKDEFTWDSTGHKDAEGTWVAVLSWMRGRD